MKARLDRLEFGHVLPLGELQPAAPFVVQVDTPAGQSPERVKGSPQRFDLRIDRIEFVPAHRESELVGEAIILAMEFALNLADALVQCEIGKIAIEAIRVVEAEIEREF